MQASTSFTLQVKNPCTDHDYFYIETNAQEEEDESYSFSYTIFSERQNFSHKPDVFVARSTNDGILDFCGPLSITYFARDSKSFWLTLFEHNSTPIAYDSSTYTFSVYSDL